MSTLSGGSGESSGSGGSKSEAAVSEPAEQEPLRVFIDVEFGSNVFISVQEFLRDYETETAKGGKTKYKSFQTVIEDLGGLEDVEIEIPPKHGDERDTYLTALRTEMMAGKGPDVFVCLSGFGAHYFENNTGFCFEESLFRFPQQAMERNMFLPLDDHIEKAQFMEWDKLTPIIMEAGKNEHGQLLLPMTYTMPLGYYRSADVEYRLEDTSLTWDDMLSGGPETLLQAANISESHQSAALAPIADYEEDQLALTEEELLEYVTSRMDAGSRLGEMDLPECSNGLLHPNNWFDQENGASDELTLVPVFSRSGGYSAIITSFAGINVNTKRPDDAFFIVDYLMSKDAQQSRLYTHMTCGNAVPTMEGLMSGRGNGVSDGDGSNVYMSKNLYPEFVKLREGISGADFYTPLDRALYDMTLEIYNNPDKPLKDLVHKAYMNMSMELAES